MSADDPRGTRGGAATRSRSARVPGRVIEIRAIVGPAQVFALGACGLHYYYHKERRKFALTEHPRFGGVVEIPVVQALATADAVCVEDDDPALLAALAATRDDGAGGRGPAFPVPAVPEPCVPADAEAPPPPAGLVVSRATTAIRCRDAGYEATNDASLPFAAREADTMILGMEDVI